MSKKDYELIARALKDSKPKRIEYESLTQWHDKYQVWKFTLDNLLHGLTQDNPRFNRAKFLQACGYND